MGEANFGDIAGLHELATSAAKNGPDFDTAGRVLDRRVNDLVGEAWTGQAAQAFSDAWRKDSTGARAINDCLNHVSGTVNRLATALGNAKKEYDNAVATAREHNVPLAAPGQTITVPDDLRAQSEQLSAEANTAAQMADIARKQAIAELEPLFAALDPNNATIGPAVVTPREAAEARQLGLSDWVKLSAAAADLYAVPGAAIKLQGARVAALGKAYYQARTAYSLAGGKRADHSVYAELKAAKKDALARLKAARGKLADVEALANKFPGSRLASTDLERGLEAAGKDISKLRILRAAPLVDLAATAYSVYDDVHNRGWSVPDAVVADSAATLAGVGAAAGIIALAPEEASVVVVAGVGMGVGYEATEAVTALTHEAHWEDNIHKYGVVEGVGHSFADAGRAFVKSNVELAEKIGDTAKHVWHGIFG
ncbi:MAG: WXG100 family type VII secretion target [Pseudonocardiaceae bacterium]